VTFNVLSDTLSNTLELRSCPFPACYKPHSLSNFIYLKLKMDNMKKFLLTSKRIALTVFAIIITSAVANAATYFSIATGNWNANTTWSLSSGGAAVGAGVFPVAGDVVNIEGGDNVTIPAGFSAFCTTLNVANSALTGTGTLTFTATGTLTVSGNIVVGTMRALTQGKVQLI